MTKTILQNIVCFQNRFFVFLTDINVLCTHSKSDVTSFTLKQCTNKYTKCILFHLFILHNAQYFFPFYFADVQLMGTSNTLFVNVERSLQQKGICLPIRTGKTKTRPSVVIFAVVSSPLNLRKINILKRTTQKNLTNVQPVE